MLKNIPTSTFWEKVKNPSLTHPLVKNCQEQIIRRCGACAHSSMPLASCRCSKITAMAVLTNSWWILFVSPTERLQETVLKVNKKHHQLTLQKPTKNYMEQHYINILSEKVYVKRLDRNHSKSISTTSTDSDSNKKLKRKVLLVDEFAHRFHQQTGHRAAAHLELHGVTAQLLGRFALKGRPSFQHILGHPMAVDRDGHQILNDLRWKNGSKMVTFFGKLLTVELVAVEFEIHQPYF